MTSGWSSFEPQQKQAAAFMFDALSTIDAVSDAIAEDGPRHAGFSDLFAYVMGPEDEMTPDLAAALESQPALQADLLRLLKQTAQYRFPRVAAASSGSVAQRDGELYRITLRPSRAEPSQVYIVIDLADPLIAPPSLLYVCRPGRRCEKHRLPVAQDGTIQILADAGAPLVEALRDNDAEVFLR